MATSRRPDIVVGIDVGQTCSGVAFSLGPDWSDPHSISRWPGVDGIEQADKVATRIGYDKVSGQIKSWGFGCVLGDEDVDVKEQFKLTLDSEYEDDRGYTCQDARKWYFDYLSCLHKEIAKFFDTFHPRWRTLNVEYSFSTPTTWKNPAMIASLQKLMEEAGFAGSPQQTVRMALTEAEAAALEASTNQYRVGEIFLICDAGGGTTDVNVLKVKSSTTKRMELEPLDHVEGEPVGSTLIDFRIAQHIVNRLELIKEHLDGDLLRIADEMLMGRFQTVKHSFPNPVVDQFSLDVKGLAGPLTFPEAGIKNSKMLIDRVILREIFDEQIDRIFSLMDERILALEAELPYDQVSYIVLSGGLGSSPYLFEQVQKRYEMNVGFNSSNTRQVRTMKVIEPQLAVVRGLVRERTQQLGTPSFSAQEVFTTRHCRNSYGVVVREAYDAVKHKGMPFEVNRMTKAPFVSEVIEWFIKQGQEVNVTEGIRQHYTSTLEDGEQYSPRQCRIVMSSLPAHRLPRRVPDGGCQEIVKVHFRLTENDMVRVNHQIWKVRKKKYWKADFWFVVKLGPADIRFEIVGRGGVLSTNHESLSVEFIDPVEAKTPKTPMKSEFVAFYGRA